MLLQKDAYTVVFDVAIVLVHVISLQRYSTSTGAGVMIHVHELNLCCTNHLSTKKLMLYRDYCICGVYLGRNLLYMLAKNIKN